MSFFMVGFLLVMASILALSLIAYYAVTCYNKISQLLMDREGLWREFSPMLSKRFELLPRLVKTLENSEAAKSPLLAPVITAYRAVLAARNMEGRIKAENMLTAALPAFAELRDEFPDLPTKDELTTLLASANKLTNALDSFFESFNVLSRNYNQNLSKFPTYIFAAKMGHTPVRLLSTQANPVEPDPIVEPAPMPQVTPQQIEEAQKVITEAKAIQAEGKQLTKNQIENAQKAMEILKAAQQQQPQGGQMPQLTQEQVTHAQQVLHEMKTLQAEGKQLTPEQVATAQQAMQILAAAQQMAQQQHTAQPMPQITAEQIEKAQQVIAKAKAIQAEGKLLTPEQVTEAQQAMQLLAMAQQIAQKNNPQPTEPTLQQAVMEQVKQAQDAQLKAQQAQQIQYAQAAYIPQQAAPQVAPQPVPEQTEQAQVTQTVVEQTTQEQTPQTAQEQKP